MNRKQRLQNKDNANLLKYAANQARLAKYICEECGEPGGHWINIGVLTLQDVMDNKEPEGFYTCHKFYGPDGKRLPEHTKENINPEPINILGELLNLIKDRHTLP